MRADRTLLVCLLSVFPLACGGGGHPASQPLSAPEPSAGGEEAQPLEVTNPGLQAALAEACTAATEVMQDRSRPVRMRAQAMERRLRQSAHRDTLNAFFEGEAVEPSHLEDHPDHIQYERVVAAAEAEGVPGFACPALERMLALLASGEEDIDPAQVASFADDLERLCAVYTEPLAEETDPSMRAYERARRVDEAITNRTLRTVFSAIASADQSQRYGLLQSAAREEGVPDFSCPALEQSMSSP